MINYFRNTSGRWVTASDAAVKIKPNSNVAILKPGNIARYAGSILMPFAYVPLVIAFSMTSLIFLASLLIPIGRIDDNI